LIWVGFCTAADYKCTLLKIEVGKFITVKLDDKERKFKLDDKTAFGKIGFGSRESESDGAELAAALPFNKGGMGIEITTKGEKDDEVVTKLVFGRPPMIKDAPPNSPGELKGTWEVDSVGKEGSTVTSLGYPLVFRDKDMEWSTPITWVFEDKGKGTIVVDTKQSPATIKLTIGDVVYKGLWAVKTEKDKKMEYLKMVLSPAGGDFPKDMPKDATLPKGIKGIVITARRENK
jgi:hypothetical protein